MSLKTTRASVAGFTSVTDLDGAWLLWRSADGRAQRVRINRAAAQIPLDSALMVRQPAQFFRRGHYEGFYWCAGTRDLHWYESLEEMTALMNLDHHFNLRAITSQPFELRFADGTKHTPDFFAIHEDGERVVYDVKHSRKIHGDVARKFALTREACERIGWRFEVLTEFSRIERHNLEWIASYRRPRYAPTADEAAKILDLVAEPRDLDTIRPDVGRIHHLYHLMWRRLITFDGTKPLTLQTTLERTAA